MKIEWKKEDKQLYLPKNKPELVTVPAYKFFTIEGKGNPNDEFFSDNVGVLYSLSYTIKMSPKKKMEPDGYFDYTVYPLEGIWDLDEDAKESFEESFNKNDLVFKLMIRQPDFVTNEYAAFIINHVKNNKPHKLLDEVKFEEITDGLCVQMMHIGSYDSEPGSFKLMEDFAEKENYKRTYENHREIYIGDPRRVSADKLRTVLRFNVAKK